MSFIDAKTYKTYRKKSNAQQALTFHCQADQALSALYILKNLFGYMSTLEDKYESCSRFGENPFARGDIEDIGVLVDDFDISLFYKRIESMDGLNTNDYGAFDMFIHDEIPDDFHSDHYQIFSRCYDFRGPYLFMRQEFSVVLPNAYALIKDGMNRMESIRPAYEGLSGLIVPDNTAGRTSGMRLKPFNSS